MLNPWITFGVYLGYFLLMWILAIKMMFFLIWIQLMNEAYQVEFLLQLKILKNS